MNLILSVIFFKITLLIHTIYIVDCRKYDIEEESMKLYGVGYKTVLLSFRQTPEYVKNLQDKIQEVKHNRADILSQIKHHFFILMESSVKEHLGYDGETDDFSSIHETELINSFTANSNINTTINNYIKVLDEYSKKRQRQPVKYTNKCKNAGYEYARRAVHAFRKNMGDIGLAERSTKDAFGEHAGKKDTAPTTTTTTTTPKPCYADEEIKDGYKYYPEARGILKIYRAAKLWESARVHCHDEGAELASPLHAGLLSAVKSLQAAESLPVVFSGVHAIFHPGIYNSVDGIPLERMPIPWAPSVDHTNLEKLHRCLVFAADGSMTDVSCDNAHPYVCFAELSACVNESRKISLPSLGNYKLDNRTGSGYLFHSQGMLWNEAYRVCQQEGGHLAIINSNREAAVLKELFSNYPPNKINARYHVVALIGFHTWNKKKPTVEDYWTIHGETLEQAGYSRWKPGQPDDFVSCGAIYRDATLDDFFDYYTAPFICEKTPRWWPSYN